MSVKNASDTRSSAHSFLGHVGEDLLCLYVGLCHDDGCYLTANNPIHTKDDTANFKHGPECSGCAYDCNGGRWVPVR